MYDHVCKYVGLLATSCDQSHALSFEHFLGRCRLDSFQNILLIIYIYNISLITPSDKLISSDSSATAPDGAEAMTGLEVCKLANTAISTPIRAIKDRIGPLRTTQLKSPWKHRIRVISHGGLHVPSRVA